MRFLAALILCSASLCAVGAAACRHPSESDAVTVTGLVQSKLNVSDFSADMCQEKTTSCFSGTRAMATPGAKR